MLLETAVELEGLLDVACERDSRVIYPAFEQRWQGWKAAWMLHVNVTVESFILLLNNGSCAGQAAGLLGVVSKRGSLVTRGQLMSPNAVLLLKSL